MRSPHLHLPLADAVSLLRLFPRLLHILPQHSEDLLVDGAALTVFSVLVGQLLQVSGYRTGCRSLRHKQGQPARQAGCGARCTPGPTALAYLARPSAEHGEWQWSG